MAINTVLTLPPGQWVQLTNANATSCKVQNRSSYSILVEATVGPIAPGSTAIGHELLPYQTINGDVLFTHLWGGVVGANRLWAFAPTYPAVISVSHADA